MTRAINYRQQEYLYNRFQREPSLVVDRVFAKNYKEVRIFDKVLYWILLILAIIGNLIVTIVLVPLLVVLSSAGLLLVLAIVATTFGLLFASLLKDIEALNPQSYVIGEIFLPIQALINAYFITLLSNSVSKTINLDNWHNPLIIGIVYTCAFVAPYIFFKIQRLHAKSARA